MYNICVIPATIPVEISKSFYSLVDEIKDKKDELDRLAAAYQMKKSDFNLIISKANDMIDFLDNVKYGKKEDHLAHLNNVLK